MYFIALKNLFHDKTKFAISVGGVAFSVLLILLLNGVYQGWNQALGSYAKSIPADLWVEQDGVGDMFHTLSFLPNNLSNQIESIEGVVKADKYLGRQMVFKQNDQDASLFIAGFNPETSLGKPNAMKEGGWENLKMGEIITDEAFVQKYNLKIGDQITISEIPLTIAAISAKGNLMMAQYAFVTFKQAEQLFNIGNKVNFYIVQLKNGADPAKIKEQIKDKISGVKILTKAEYVDASRQSIVDGFLPIVYVLVFISVLVGIAVIGLTIYSATVEKSREFGVMKAIGVSNGQLLGTVIIQSIIAAVIGYIIGVMLSYPVSIISNKLVVGFVTTFRPLDLTWIFGVTIFMSLAASYIPIRRITAIDPAEVFKN